MRFMHTVAYITNSFPSATEPYVIDEIRELRRRGIQVIAFSAQPIPTNPDSELRRMAAEALSLRPLHFLRSVQATWLLIRNLFLLFEFLTRILLRGSESARQRIAALAHTWLGAYFAVMLAPWGVDHIHVHHGYYSSWVAMIAARLLGIEYSLTVHGSDLLLHGVYLNTKLQNCGMCFTVSEFNRNYILNHYPDIDPGKVFVQRIGVDVPTHATYLEESSRTACSPVVILSVGRLHPVKDHAFLIQACQQLKKKGMEFLCLIAGDGPERDKLEYLIYQSELFEQVRLLGHVSHSHLRGYYEIADMVVLTSRSEGIPLTLMEAMAHAKPVIAPAITGIPELVSDGRTGFLYSPGNLNEFVANVEMVANARAALGPIGRAARRHVLANFDRQKNLVRFADRFLTHIGKEATYLPYEDPVLQQI